MKLTFLGTGTSHGLPYIGCDCAVCSSTDPLNKRLRSSVLVESADASSSLLIDTSPDLRQQFLREKVTQISAVLYTHIHNDHVVGLDDLRPITDRTGYLPVFATASTQEHVQNLFGYGFTQGRQYPGFPRFTPHVIEPKVPFQFQQFQITPIPILHGKDEILAYRIENAGSTLVYATDCSQIPEGSWELMDAPDVFVVDALRKRPHPTHFTVEQALEAAHKLRATRTFFTHISHDLDHHKTQDELPASVEMSYDGLKLSF